MVFEGWVIGELPRQGDKVRYQNGELWTYERTTGDALTGFEHVPPAPVLEVQRNDALTGPDLGVNASGMTAGERAGEIMEKVEAVARVQALELPQPSDGLKSLVSVRAGELGVDVKFERILDDELGGLRWQVRMRTPRGDVKQPVIPVEGESADVTWERACEQLGLV